MWNVFMKNMELFGKRGVRFYGGTDEDFNVFQGYDHNSLEKADGEKIKLFLRHISEVIADSDENVIEYFHNWFSYLLQNPGKKNKTCLVVTGPAGSGKTKMFTNVWSKILGRYAKKNETNIDNVTGKFNDGLENKKLIVINELKNADTNKFLNCDMLKTLITETEFS